MTPHRVHLTRTVTAELSVEVYAADAKEAERLAIDLCPEDGRDWTVIGREVEAKAEDTRS